MLKEFQILYVGNPIRKYLFKKDFPYPEAFKEDSNPRDTCSMCSIFLNPH